MPSRTKGAIMMGWGYGSGRMHAGGWIAMGLFWIAIVVTGVWGLGSLFPRGADSRDPTAILKHRLASGEITLAEYKKASGGSGASC